MLQFCFKCCKAVACFLSVWPQKLYFSWKEKMQYILQTTGFTKKADGLAAIKTKPDHWTVTATKTILLERPRKEMKMKANVPT